jgi:ACS family glucarate transporter-like MFS transporter
MGNALALGITASAIAWVGGWRPVLWFYGLLGLLLAAAGWRILRDSPHAQESRSDNAGFPWGALIRSRGLWIFNLGAIGMNLGWAFLITWLPTYLREVRGMDSAVSLRYISWALAFGMTGMLFGGWFGDKCVSLYGTLWGRRIPILSGSILAATCYLAAPLLSTPEWTIATCGMVAFASDSITPSIWGMVQDIGGKKSASTMAWVNMWGNLGASVVAKVIPLFLASRWHQQNWADIFILCATGFAVLGVSALAVDTRQRVEA